MNEYLSQNLGMTQQHIMHNLLRLLFNLNEKEYL